MHTEILKHKRLNFKKLEEFGFKKTESGYCYTTDIMANQFQLRIWARNADYLQTEMIEKDTGEEYTLHYVQDAQGTFVGDIRDEYNGVIERIITNCCDVEIFKSEYTKMVIEYARERYGDEVEYLWERFPDNEVLRRRDTKKWYAAILTVKREKLGLAGEGTVEVLDLRSRPQDMEQLQKQIDIYPGYHMNKKSWYTILLDGTTEIVRIYGYIDKSYELATK